MSNTVRKDLHDLIDALPPGEEQAARRYLEYLRDAGDPVENGRFYDEEGADELVFLDITASSDRRDIILNAFAPGAAELFHIHQRNALSIP